jgi:predicted RNase H-like nuclease (RuvC/YqgF family)
MSAEAQRAQMSGLEDKVRGLVRRVEHVEDDNRTLARRVAQMQKDISELRRERGA